MKALAARYAGRVEFVFVYCRESHPPEPDPDHPRQEPIPFLHDSVPQRQSLDVAERREAAAFLRSELEPQRRLLVDGLGEHSLFHRLFGGAGIDNPAIVVAPDGRVELLLRWTNAAELERFLSGPLGPAPAGMPMGLPRLLPP